MKDVVLVAVALVIGWLSVAMAQVRVILTSFPIRVHAQPGA
jgi:hypothetical protein